MQLKRHELKYYLSDLQTDALIGKLQHILKTDQHGSPTGGYKVRSLYFDSVNDECLYEKQSGILYRKKIRLRTYGNSGTDTVKFEIKHKHGQLVNKESIIIDRDDAREICAGEYRLLLNYDSPVLDRIYALFSSRAYTPKVIVEYRRKAFVYPAFNVRITFDQDLRSNINHLDLFSTTHDSMPIIQEGKQVLEVKYDHYFPGFLKGVLANASSERMAISKYTLARRFHKQHKWEDN